MANPVNDIDVLCKTLADVLEYVPGDDEEGIEASRVTFMTSLLKAVSNETLLWSQNIPVTDPVARDQIAATLRNTKLNIPRAIDAIKTELENN